MSEIDRTRRSHRPSPSPRAIAASAAASTSKPKNAAEVQRAQLEKLFVDPSREVYIPAPPKAKTLAPPRDMIPNVQGSSAGAGSGEFHVYKQSRRREYERLKQMEVEDAKEKAERIFADEKRSRQDIDDAKTAKNRAKRLKKKKAKKGSKPGNETNPLAATTETFRRNTDDGNQGTSDSDSSGSDDARDQKKKRKLGQGAPGAILFRGKDERKQDDDQPREEDITAKRIEETVLEEGHHAPVNGLKILDDD